MWRRYDSGRLSRDIDHHCWNPSRHSYSHAHCSSWQCYRLPGLRRHFRGHDFLLDPRRHASFVSSNRHDRNVYRAGNFQRNSVRPDSRLNLDAIVRRQRRNFVHKQRRFSGIVYCRGRCSVRYCLPDHCDIWHRYRGNPQHNGAIGKWHASRKRITNLGTGCALSHALGGVARVSQAHLEIWVPHFSRSMREVGPSRTQQLNSLLRGGDAQLPCSVAVAFPEAHSADLQTSNGNLPASASPEIPYLILVSNMV